MLSLEISPIRIIVYCIIGIGTMKSINLLKRYIVRKQNSKDYAEIINNWVHTVFNPVGHILIYLIAPMTMLFMSLVPQLGTVFHIFLVLNISIIGFMLIELSTFIHYMQKNIKLLFNSNTHNLE